MPTVEEFGHLPYNDGDYTEFSLSLGNWSRNKHLNTAENGVVPFDENRVQLKLVPYINASWINAPASDKTYSIAKIHPYLPMCQIGLICTQIPNKNSIDIYNKMILDHKVGMIVHFSSPLVELANPEKIFGESLVSKKTMKMEEFKHFLDKEKWEIDYDEKVHQLKFFRFKGWPRKERLDGDAIRKMLSLISIIRNEVGGKNGISWYKYGINMVVQDDHGGSSTAAIFISLLCLLEQIDGALLSGNYGINEKEPLSIDIFKKVSELRRKRMKMITNFEEYKFLYQCVMHYVHHKDDYDKLIKHEDKKIMETSNNNQNSNLQAVPNEEPKNRVDDEIPFEYADDDVFGYAKWTADGYAIDKRSSRSVKDLIHSEGDYFDGYKVYS